MKKNTIQDMQRIAEERGGKCLSTIYINGRSKLRWECREGHQWETVPNCITSGSWCPACGLKKLTIEYVHELAKERGGKCLSAAYINTRSKLRWECKEGHQWEAMPNSIIKGSWCPACFGTKKSTIPNMRRIAWQHGGKCLSTRYVNAGTKLRWECREGHQWEAKPTVVQQGRWCPTCGGTKRSTIRDMRRMAGQHGGKCLSLSYINARTKLRWECKEGHQWEAKPTRVQQNHWCPKCKRKQRLKLQLKELENQFEDL